MDFEAASDALGVGSDAGMGGTARILAFKTKVSLDFVSANGVFFSPLFISFFLLFLLALSSCSFFLLFLLALSLLSLFLSLPSPLPAFPPFPLTHLRQIPRTRPIFQIIPPPPTRPL